MAENQNTTDPFFQDWQDWQLFDPVETDFDFDDLLRCPTSTTEDSSSYLTSITSEGFDVGEPFQDCNTSFSQSDCENAQAFFPDETIPAFHPQGMISSSVERTVSLPLTPNLHHQMFFPSSAPQLGTYFNGEETSFNFSQPTETNFPSGLPEPLVGAWSPCTASQAESSRASHKSSPGPGFIEFIQYTVDSKTNKMKKFDSNADNRKGRKGRLTEGQRRDAGRMRKVGACSSCRKRREKCDEGLYCRACVHYFKDNLIYHPCRGKWLDSLADVLLDGNLPWHPSAKTLDDFLGAGRYRRSIEEITVPINFSFGPPLNMRARLIRPEDPSLLLHNHIAHSFPPTKDGCVGGADETHVVLPVVLADSSPEVLKPMLDKHLGYLVDEWFQDFPLYDSRLTVLGWIWTVYQQLEERVHRDLMQKTLKLLVLVHIGDVISVEPSFPLVELCLRSFAASHRGPNSPPSVVTPCFIRAQLGGVIEVLAKSMLKEILATLEPLSLSARCSDWFVVLSVNSLLFMAMETIQYHGHRAGFHDLQDFPPKPSSTRVFGPQRALLSGSSTETCMTVESHGVDHLLKFYIACFGNCHSRLGAASSTPRSANMSRSTSLGSMPSPTAAGPKAAAAAAAGRNGKQRASPNISNRQQDVADKFIKGLRDAIEDKRSYLETCKRRDFQANSGRGNDPMWLFDRLLARLLLIEC